MKRILILLSIISITSNTNKEYCDIKGNIKNPGVYEIKEDYTIQDIINDAGGLKKNSFTDNINLSKKVTDEMVIYIFNNDEITKAKKNNICKCYPIYKYIECENTNNEEIKEITTTITTTTPITTSTLTTIPTTTINNTTTNTVSTTKITEKIENEGFININTATIEELKTLKGLGESKANKIIEYRNTNGLFKTIEELLSVDGIGKTTFEKIKDYIKI